MTNQIREENIKRDQIVDIAEISIFIFLLPTFLALSSIVYILTQKTSNILISLFIFVPFFVVAFLNYSYKKIYLTKSSLYYFKSGISIFSVKLNDDFFIFDIKQSVLGKLLNYGEVIIVNRDNQFISCPYVSNPLKLKNKLVKRYETEMKKVDPTFILPREYVITEDEKLDRLS